MDRAGCTTPARRLVAAAGLLVMAGCIVVPRTQQIYDADCQVMRHSMTLEAGVVGNLGGCRANECAALLATYGIVAAASLVVSGSIVVVGNVVYWIERQGPCPTRG
jgi:hypothetical protein